MDTLTVAPALSETKLITGDELLALGDIGPSELIDGRIVTMSPVGGEHGNIALVLGALLKSFARENNLGRVVGGGIGIYIRRNPDRVRAADVAFISRQRSPGRPLKGFLEVAPELVVEIVSPNDTWAEVRQKVKEYFSIGVLWVWVIDPENHEVLVYRSPNEVVTLSDADVLKGEGVLEGFAVTVASLFED